jgi:aspartyl-tRNA(Asn)/glutamyl-tRNA(Gln) amidotransferase subunit A
MSNKLCWMSASEIARQVRAGRLSPREPLEAVLAQADRVNPRVNALITRLDESARAQALALESRIAAGEPVGPLAGVPVSVKDLHLMAGVRTTFGCKLYEDFVAEWDHPIVERLRAADAILFAKTNTSEFGLVPLTANSIFGDSHNPWQADCNTGGSSGGSAAAVACGMGPLATGSDGGGSIRVPAAFCGVYGLKPQMGRIPHVAFPRGWESLSHQGVLSRNVLDTALALDVLSGPHPADRQSLPAPAESFVAACRHEPRGWKLAWCPRLGDLAADAEVLEICEQAALRFEDLGCVVDEVALDLPDLGPAQQQIVLCEAATAMEPLREAWRNAVFPANRKIYDQAQRLTFQDLIHANWSRDDYLERLAPLFAQYDALLTPTASITAPKNGTLGPKELNGAPQRSLFWLSYCVPFNMTGQPAASLPAGRSASGLPVGLQIVGGRFDEARVLALSAAYQEAYDWTLVHPPAAM